MSEPDSGSDLASIRSAARRDVDGWVLTGTKVWTSHAHRCRWMLAVVRTSRSDHDRRAGLSQFIVDLHRPGVTVRPLRLLDGEHHFNEVVFDDVRLPAGAHLGAEGAGWAQLTAELAFERSGPERILTTMPLLEAAADLMPAPPVGELVSVLSALRAMSAEVARSIDGGGEPDMLLSALVKSLGVDYEMSVAERVRLAADMTTASDDLATLYRDAVRHSPGFSLRGGTTEVMYGIVARGLGVR